MWGKVGPTGNANQQWTYTPGTGLITLTANPNKALTVSNATPNNGDPINLQTVTQNLASQQQWNYDPTNKTIALRTQPGILLSIQDGAQSKNGGALWLWTSIGPNGNSNQHWSIGV